MNNIGQRIKKLRKKNDLTQEKLADFLGVTYKAVSKWECGLTVPDLALIMPLTKILHVSADELLGGKTEEMDARRAELDEHCDNYFKYDAEDNYQMALQAVSEYPGDYKYLAWLASMEMSVAYHTKYKENPTMQYSSEMIDRAVRHNNIVIEECDDPQIREKAIWNAMVCCKTANQYEEALKYAEMFPTVKAITRDRAMEMCLQGEQLIAHRQMISYSAFDNFCRSLLQVYMFAEHKEPHIIAALDTEEAVLKTVFSDGNYLLFHWHLYCVYEKRTELEIRTGDYDKAMEYLKIMLNHVKQTGGEGQCYTSGIFDHIFENTAQESLSLPYIMIGKDDTTKPFFEQVKDRLMKEEVYAPLREREDFKALLH